MDGSTLVALEMNGEPIPAIFGGPLRLIVSGWYGMASVKWLARVEAVETPFEGEFQTERYVYAPGAPVTSVKVKSMFTDLPAEVPARVPLRITGLAWGGAGIARVQVAAGAEWREARLVGPILPHAWRRFRAAMDAACARAISAQVPRRRFLRRMAARCPVLERARLRHQRRGGERDRGAVTGSDQRARRKPRLEKRALGGQAFRDAQRSWGGCAFHDPPRALRRPSEKASAHHSQTLPAQSKRPCGLRFPGMERTGSV